MRLCSLLTEKSSHWQSFGLDGHEADTRHQESDVMRVRKKWAAQSMRTRRSTTPQVNAKNGCKAQNVLVERAC